MITLDDTEIVAAGETVTIPVPVSSPVNRGSVDVWLSASRAGPPARGALVRTLVVKDSPLPPFTLFTRDIVAQWPRGARAWLVVSYAGTVIATGVVRVVVP